MTLKSMKMLFRVAIICMVLSIWKVHGKSAHLLQNDLITIRGNRVIFIHCNYKLRDKYDNLKLKKGFVILQ
jgi:rRNA maturation protein Rpf1